MVKNGVAWVTGTLTGWAKPGVLDRAFEQFQQVQVVQIENQTVLFGQHLL
ncbi:hypothetical protein LPH55_03315 [Xylella taiwanensis]|uniref:Uncharacterized protein n=1 Tax=Xylella taiwanensis TaxID=1444770 RepID=A0ABS8TV11_9GAMM|nr:hypothetical protein [Xylella taiwanensis]MCD8472525.1 hypothetical protein [Xylella taiwanensis]